jgi:hypothetical protein
VIVSGEQTITTDSAEFTGGKLIFFSRIRANRLSYGISRCIHKPKNGCYFIMQIPLPLIPALLPQGEGRKPPLFLGEGRGEGKKLAMQEVIAKHSFQLSFLG